MTKLTIDWNDLPDADWQESTVVIASEWKVNNGKGAVEAIQRIRDNFEKYSLNHKSTKGQLSYTCFLNVDDQHIFHFSQWKDEEAIHFFNENDPAERIPRMLENLEVTRLGKAEYFPYQSVVGALPKSKTGLIVFIKQYFEKQGQAICWIDKILNVLNREGVTEGLIGNTYYINSDGSALLNYALWENEHVYDQFLKHPHVETQQAWKEIANHIGLIKERGELKRHKNFIRIY